MRCEASFGMAGTCAPCDATEVPYDGLDNDCDPRTPDHDLDRDGEDSPQGGGADCDDHDPEVSSKKPEICGDGKDNDCDGQVDELDCGDKKAPSVSIVAPDEGAILFGTFDVVAELFDDVGVVSAQVFVDSVPVASRDFTPPISSQTATFVVDSLAQGLVDGPATISVELLDVAGKVGRASRDVLLDNRTPPTVTPLSPLAGKSYGGRLRIEAGVQDQSGVAEVEFSLSGNLVHTATSAPYRTWVDTSSITDGTATVTISAVDIRGNSASTSVVIAIDNTPPLVVFTRPAAGSVVSRTASITVTAVDAAGIRSVEALGMVGTSPLELSVDTELLPGGPLVIPARAFDATIVDDMPVGNVGSASLSLIVDNSDRVPRVVVTPADGDGVFGVTAIRATATSPIGKAISRVEMTLDGEPLAATFTNNEYRASFDFLFYPRATAVIRAVAYDVDGRIGEVASTVIIVRPPTFRVAPSRLLANGFTSDGIAVGDVDGDGVPDVVAGGNKLQVLTGTIGAGGSWSPEAARVLDTVNGATRLALIDTDGDGDLDLFTVDANKVRMYLNDGGVFDSAPDVTATFAQFNTYNFLQAGDLDGDGDADVVLSGPNGVDALVIRNEANGAFTFLNAYGLVGSVTDLLLADADGDGDLDVVIGRGGTSNVITTYRNSGNGIFGAGQDSFAPGPAQYVALGDVTGDGFPDVVAAIPTVTGLNPASGGVVVMRGDPATPGTFLNVQLTLLAPQAREVRLADLDMDGALDVVVSSYQANGVDLLYNLGGGVLPLEPQRRFVTGRHPIEPVLFDLDGDGDLDYLAVGSTDQALVWSKNLGLGDLLAAPVLTPSAAPRALATGDVYASDGQDDLVLAFAKTGTISARVSIWQNAGGSFTRRATLVVGTAINTPTSVAIGDLDGLGPLDIAVGSNTGAADLMTHDGTAAVLVNDGSGFALQTMDIPRPLDVAIADVDGDGIGEAVFTFDSVQGAFDGSEVWDFAGGGQVRLRQWSEGIGARAVTAVDRFYAVANGTSNDITVTTWNGLGWNATTYTALPGIADLAVGYVGNDQDADIVAVGTPGLVLMLGLPGGGFSQPATFAAGTSPSRLVAGDFNGDGLNDVLVLNNNSLASALIGKPNGGFFPPLSIAVGDAAVDFVSADFDGDGRGDVAIACTGVPGVVLVFSNGDAL